MSNEKINVDNRPTGYTNSPLATVTALSDIKIKRELEYGKNPDNKNVITNITLHIVARDWDVEDFKSWSGSAANYGIASDGTIVQVVEEKYSAGTNAGYGSNAIDNPLGKDNTSFSNNSVTIEIANLRAPSGTGRNEGYFTATNGQEYHYKNGKVEMNGEYYEYPITNEALDSTIRLVADIAKRNELGELYHDGYKGTLTWHSDFPDVRKSCPGDYVKAMTNYIMESANEINEKGYYIPDYSISSQSGNGLMQIVTSGSNPFEDGTISSSMYTVVDSVNKIRGSISGNEALVATQKPVVDSTSTIPASLVDAHSSLFSISSDLVSTLNNETKVIASIAQTYYEMDQYLSSQAGNFSDGGNGVDTSPYDAKVTELINTDLSSAISFSTYMFNPSSHVEGNSGKLCLSDINSMLSGNSLAGPLAENLASERESAKETKNQVDSLIQTITSNNELKGSAWDQVATKLGTYSDLMDTRVEACNIMETATVKALKLIKDYMGDYEELDDSKLPALRQKIVDLKADIVEAQNIINATKQVTHTGIDSNGKSYSYTTTEYVFSAAARKQAMITIENAKRQIAECEKEIAKLEGLPIILAQAEQIMNDALSEIYSKYGTKVSDVVTGKESSFTPPSNTNYTGTLPAETKKDNQDVEVPEGKVSREHFDQSLGLQHTFGTYNDYLNGVESKDNPMYNPAKEDSGIEADDIPSDEPIVENPDVDNENGQEKPEQGDNSSNDDVTPDDDSGNNNSGNNNSGNNNSGNNNSGNNSSGNNNSGNNNSGNNSSGNNDSGNNNSGNNSSGNNNSGNDDSGNNDSGNNSSGNNNSGNDNSGNNDSGNNNSGNNNSGNNDSGNNNSGNDNSGNTDSGNVDTGNNNSGNSNSGNNSSGNNNSGNDDSGNTDSGNVDTGNNNSGNSNIGNNTPNIPSKPSVDSGVDSNPSVPGDTNDNIVDNLPNDNVTPDTGNDSPSTVPPIVEIPDNDEIIDITPDDVYQNNTDDSNSSTSSDLAKKIAIGMGVSAVAGAAALGAHTYSKAKKNNIYEDD